MAGISKITLATEDGDRVLVDLTGDNVTADSLVTGYTAHGADGEIVEGANPYELEPTNAEVGTQSDLIAQIQNALVGKAAGSGGGKPEQDKIVAEDITTNGPHTFYPDDGYTMAKVTVNVNVPDVPAVVDRLEVDENGTYKAADEGLDGYSEVVVNVAGGGGGDSGEEIAALLENTLTTIDNSICTSLRTRIFQGATKLVTVNLPSVTSAGSYAFYQCSGLEIVKLPKLTSVSTQCFYSCTNLQHADCGQLGNLPAQTFNACSALTELILRKTSSICTLSNVNAVNNTPIGKSTGYVYVPSALIDTYKAASNWSTFAAQFRAIEDYPEICGTGV